jgi:hypothetical protein
MFSAFIQAVSRAFSDACDHARRQRVVTSSRQPAEFRTPSSGRLGLP